MSKRTKRLSADKGYRKPKVTQQEQLTAEEIKDKLVGYEKVDDISDVPLDTHLRYFAKQKDGSHLFRLGGFLHNKQNASQYVVLRSSDRKTWSVQVNDAIFYRKVSHKDEVELLKKQIQEYEEVINSMNNIMSSKLNVKYSIKKHKFVKLKKVTK